MSRQHGTYSRYSTGCRCEPCVVASRRYNSRVARLKAYGRWAPYVDGDIVRQHLGTLLDGGMNIAGISRISGVPGPTILCILAGTQRRGHRAPPNLRVRIETANLLSTVSVSACPYGFRDPTGSRRRARALCVIGWSFAAQAVRVGRSLSSYHRSVSRSRWITNAAALAVNDLYDELSMTPAPRGFSAARTKATAASHGWSPPLAWDDDSIDNPTAVPVGLISAVGSVDRIAVERVVITGELPYRALNRFERMEAVQLGRDRGMTEKSMSRGFGVAGGTIKSMLERLAA